MASPYRESHTPPAPVPELEWRRRVATSARWAAVLTLANLALLVANHWLPARFVLAVVVAWSVLGAGVAVATWRLTARRPSGRVGSGGWLLRITLPALLAVVGLRLLGVHLEMVNYVTCAVCIAALIHSSRSKRPESWRQPFGLVFVGAGTIFISLLLDSLGAWPLGLQLHVAVLFFAAFGFEALRHQLLPVDQHWWFDGEKEAPGEWVSLLVYRDWLAEVLRVGGKLGSFASEEKAVEWLEDKGYRPAERALAEHLVVRAPPDVLPVAHRRKRLRVEQSEPRVRVEADPSDRATDEARDDAIDELDDNAVADGLDTAEPPRTLAVEEPHQH